MDFRLRGSALIRSIPQLGARDKHESTKVASLDSVCEFIVDCEHKTAPTQAEGYPSIRTPNIGRGRLILEGVTRVSLETYRAWSRRAEPREGDLILAREAPVGNVAIVTRGLEVCLGQRTVLIRPDRAKVSPGYLVYLLLSRDVQSRFHATTNGATVPHLNLRDIRGLSLPSIPPRSVQDRVDHVLSAYDDLIENNTKRVVVLQKLTEFVFAHVDAEAGARNTPKKLGELADETGGRIRTGPFGSQLHESDYAQAGTPVVMPTNLIGGRIDTSGIARVGDDIVHRLNQHQLSEGDIVYGRRGDIGRRAFIRKPQAGWLCGTGCLRISLQGGALHSRYLHQYLGKPAILAFIRGRAIGATMPNLNTSILRDVPIAVPTRALQDKFTRIADANDKLIDILAEKSDVLRRKRDLLLPRLISGELDVSSLSLPADSTP